jgi:hypothetical protein
MPSLPLGDTASVEGIGSATVLRSTAFSCARARVVAGRGCWCKFTKCRGGRAEGTGRRPAVHLCVIRRRQVCVCVCVGAYACAYAEERYQLKEASQHAGRVGLGGGPDMSRRTGPGAWDPSDHPTCTPLPLVSAVPVRTLVRGCVRMPIRRRRRGNLQKASWRFTGPP